MKGATLLLLLLAAAPAFAQGPAERVFLEVECDPAVVYVQQPFRLILRVGIESGFAEENLVSLFNRRMDLQLHVRAPWLLDLPDVERLADRPPGEEAERLSLAVNDDVIEAVSNADRTIGGRDFTVVEIERTFRAACPGEIRVSAPTLRFAFATEFVKDFISGKRPKDRRDLTVTGEPLELTILPFPTEGRPANFTGAVGSFRVLATADTERAEVDDVIKLTLTIEGRGNLATFDTPDLGELPGFHVLGAIDDHGADRRTIVYDLIVLPVAKDGIPAIAFPFFDPGPPALYLLTMTDPIPLQLAPVAGTPPAPAPGTDSPSNVPIVWLTLSLVMIVIALVTIVRRRARKSREVDPRELLAQQALSEFRAALAEPESDLAAAFVQYLSVHLRCAAAGVITSELANRLMAAGVPEDPATRAAALVESLVAMNYGSTLSAGDAAAHATRMVEELEPHFRE